MPRILFATVFSLLAATALAAEIRKWTSKDGQYSTEAELVEQDNVNVTLKKESGETVTVPLARLSDADRRYLRELKKKPAAPKEPLVSYTNFVQPFLAQYCADCHNQGKSTAGYDVTSYEALLRRGQYGALVVPGKPDISRLAEVMEGISKSMPPKASAQPRPDEIAQITAWIQADAKDDSNQQPAAGKARGPVQKKTARRKS